MKRRHLFGAAGAIAALLALSSYASPYWTLHRMHTAIADKDAERFSSYVDFPAVRDSVKGQLLAMMQRQLAGRDLADNPFTGLGRMVGAALVTPLVDAVVSPAGVSAMFESGKVEPLPGPDREAPPPEQEQAARPDYAVDYESWSRVAVSRQGGDTGRFILKRTGLWSWQLAALEFPRAALAPAR